MSQNESSVVRCRKCGYDLRGHSVGGTCPECAGPIPSTVARPRPSRRASLALVGGGIGFAVLHALLFVVVTQIGPFELFEPWYSETILLAPIVAIVFALLLSPRGARFHRLAIVTFTLTVLGTSALALAVIAAA